MDHVITDVVRIETILRHLKDNAHRCEKGNIIVRVDSVNNAHNVAFCSVEQRSRGLFRRSLSVHELTHLAEEALAPLIGLGLIPLITVHHSELRNAKAAELLRMPRTFVDGIKILADRLGIPLWREGFSRMPGTQDPFGWKQAMTLAGRS